MSSESSAIFSLANTINNCALATNLMLLVIALQLMGLNLNSKKGKKNEERKN